MNDKNVVLKIESMSYSSDGIAHLEDGRVCFVDGAVPGDTVEVKLTYNNKRFTKGKVVKVLEPSKVRVTPECSPAIYLSGCSWGNIAYASQLEYKTKNVKDNLRKIGHIDQDTVDTLVKDTLPSKDQWGYRNKVELNFSRDKKGKAQLGMNKPGTNEIIKVKTCELLPKKFEKLPKSIAGALTYMSNSSNLEFERIGIRASKRTNDVEVALWTEPGAFPRGQVAKVLNDSCKTTSIVRVLTKGPSKARKIVGVERLSGKGSWSEKIANETMKLSAPSFFQVNTRQAEKLVELVMNALEPTDTDLAMDLYSGAGTFTLPLARKVNFVEAVESYGPAVRDLRRNLEENNLNNAEPTGGDAAREFPDFNADIIVVDPPRAGLAEEVVKQLSEQTARAIAYVSCDPATLARDISRFREIGTYDVEWVQPVDLFPQTYHVECVCKLVRKK